ncbi:MAG: hypothetical protein JXQ68_05910 [Campylobacterales bacterium]|nr:hypothetical protein [Campylobacterales bacterium]
MKSKHINRALFLFFSALLIIFISYSLWLYPPDSDISKALPQDETTKALDDYNLFGGSKKLFVLIKGVNEDSLKKANAIKKKLLNASQITDIYFNGSDIPQKALDYIEENWYYLADFKTQPISQEDVEKKIQNLAQELSSNALYASLNRSDPMGLFSLGGLNFSSNTSENLTLGDKGYLLIASIKPNIGDIENSTLLQDEVETILKEYPNTVVFCPNFYSVENSAYIKQDVHSITLISVIIIIFVYFMLMRNITMLLFSVTTLILSALSAILITRILFEDVSILVVAFGIGIASIAEDYLFMLFLNDDYKNKRFNYEVFWGFLTTEIGLLLLGFIDFPLISQLSIFAAISLSISYGIFVFIFPKFEFYKKNSTGNFHFQGVIPPFFIAAISLVILSVTITRLNFDTDFRHLDYQNEKLLKKEALFQDVSLNTKTPILIYAQNIDALLAKTDEIKKSVPSSYTISNVAKSNQEIQKRKEALAHYDFKQLRAYIKQYASEAGFREGIFDTVYKEIQNLKPYTLDMEILESFGVEIIKSDNEYISLGYIDSKDEDKLENFKDIKIIDASKILKKSALRSLDSMRNILFMALVFISMLIIFVTKKRAVYALNFILFPLAMEMLFLSLESSFNIMHIFAVFFVAIYGVDYGIYLSKQNISQSIKAVAYSCVTTFAGFGILAFSDVNALSSIGEITLIGIISITFLILQKRDKIANE